MSLYIIIWSEFAETQLDNIYDYYVEKVSIETSKKIVLNIIEDIEHLAKNPFIGTKDDILNHRKLEYRYLISSNYKVIYTCETTNKQIKITDIFDTRQNPTKINRNN